MKRLLYFLVSLCFFAQTALPQNALILAGGGAEGDQGDTSAWSYHLYRHLILGPDTNQDGQIKVVILATSVPSQPADANWLPNYFQWLGQDAGVTVTATNLAVSTKNAANQSGTVATLNDADALFIKGGDQGEYYDLWNGTLLETKIRDLANRNGRLGGTSAGAMSMAEFAFAGGKDMISDDVLADAHSTYLDDNDGGSGIHTDFLGFLPGVVIDTHFTQRGRLGRLAGILAKAHDDHNRNDLLGIGLEMNTGVFIENQTALVIGEGSVTVLLEDANSMRNRIAGKPLVYTDIIMNRLTDGWQFNPQNGQVHTQTIPAGSSSTSVILNDSANSGALNVDGSDDTEVNKFAFTGSFYPNDYASVAGSASPYIRDSQGFTDAGNSNNRMDKHETLFHLLHDHSADIGILVFSGGSLSRAAATPEVIDFGGTLSSLVIDASPVTHKGLSPYPSPWATAGGRLRAATLVGSRLHIIGDSATHGKAYNTRTHQLTDSNGGGTNPGQGTETENNDSISSANDFSGENLPLNISGTIASSNDRDYFQFELQSGQAINIQLNVPSGVDYDLYLLDRRGRTLDRSVNDGNGLDESISYQNTSNRSKTIYIQVSSYSGSGAAYLLNLTN